MLTPPLLFAVLSAGLLGGVHCIGMCGGIANILNSAGTKPRKTFPIIPASTHPLVSKVSLWRFSILLHSGRIFTYTLMGALTGAIGALGLHFNPFQSAHTLLYLIGNLALIWLGLRLFGYRPRFGPLDRLLAKITTFIHLSPRLTLMTRTQRFPFLVGMAWGCLPCGLIYGVLPFSLLSGNAISGAALMLVFGLSALPHLLFAQGIAQWLRHSHVSMLLRGMGASLLTGIGLMGLWWNFNMAEMPSFLCVTATR